ncbi:MAG: Gfo/Idh/MocA family oxidoreductase [Thermodesulfobacteriota bacterium]
MIRMGVIGYGYWGPNIVRNFNSTEGLSIASICDLNPDRLKRAKRSYPGIELTTDANEILSSSKIDAVAVVAPLAMHFDLAKRALENGKYVFVEKPFTQTAAQAEELIELADRKKLKIMVDHTFLFTGAVRKIKQVIDEGILGDLYYFDSIRVNLGLFYHDANVIWDLAPHDFSIMDYLIKEKLIAVAATGRAHFNHGLEDVAYVTIFLSNNMIAHFNVNWLSPVKVRTTLIGGDKKMLVWNDLDADEKIKIYDKGVEVKNGEKYDLLVSYRSGDMWVPKIDQIEALKLEAEYFVECMTNGKVPINDGNAGLRVVKMLEAANRSLKNKGEMVSL